MTKLPKRLEEMIEKSGHQFVQECPKYSGYPEHMKTYKAGATELALAVLAEAEKVVGVLEHAIDLGYLGEGSTQGYAKDTLADWRKFVGGGEDV